jgi:hypothetical protein
MPVKLDIRGYMRRVLEWHRGYNTADAWTKAGGVQPEDWPEWMKRYRDY